MAVPLDIFDRDVDQKVKKEPIDGLMALVVVVDIISIDQVTFEIIQDV